MRQTTYSVLLTIRVQHGYFQDPATKCLTIGPTAATADRLRRAGLLTRYVGSDFVVLSPRPLAEHKWPAGFFPLTFRVQPDSPYFHNFTDLPLTNGAGHVYYLSAPRAGADPLRLTAQAQLGAADRVVFRPLTFDFVPAKPPGQKLILELLDVAGNEVVDQTELAADATAWAVDLRRRGSGRYQLRTPTATLLDFYAADSRDIFPGWGVLEILALPATAAPTFTLECGPRATFWQYWLSSKTPPLPPALRIEAIPRKKPRTEKPAAAKAEVLPPKLVAFIPTSQTLPAGVSAGFVSVEAIALTERPTVAYQLLSTLPAVPNIPQVLLPDLPQADTASFRVEQHAGQAAGFSDVFIQL
ncbi:hypothetical protein [Hymenobacter chitinivorans]|uniref:Uncharacterized protein n=1 Tax=Hymenobacter chitinivorans DSM 11115 TaxID=1121954 RepID=A0A2M9BS43_9BACT|nr:hypothetical protein [Hymenobacter chitinivorans]PJJ60774.1 hypothetical protein CLV45_2207 [Hymenobacter chitinivorans DSM 11115]